MSCYLDSDNESVFPACREAAREILRLEREGKRLRLEQALAFAVVLTRRLVYTYLLVAVFSVGEWARIYLASLRFGLQTLPAGGGAAAFNPFQLAQPAPGADPLVVSFILFIAAVFLLSCGQMLFTRRGYLLK
ncbi:MAG: hypothetical protein AB1330_12185 [Bacillota bacterium]